LHVEWRIPENGNSGVFLRVPAYEGKESPSQKGVEVQILDDNGSQYQGKLKPWQYSGSLYTFVAASPNVFKGAGAWNTFAITCKGDKITVVYNGTKVAEGDAATVPAMAARPRRGFIGLQNHGSGVEFRVVRIKEL
jgi:hypothetical protein